MIAIKNKRTGNWLFKFMYQRQAHKTEGFPTRDMAVQAESARKAEIAASRR